MSLDEFSLISLLSAKLKTFGDVVVGIGDDAAVVRKNGGYLFLTTDVLIEDVHFSLSWEKFVSNLFFLIGRKLIAVSLSDVASMGGVPLYALVNLCLPSDYDYKRIEELYDGISEISKEYSVSVLGGDTSRSKVFAFSSFVVGEGTSYMLRSGAVVGDLVAVTGTLGDSGAGLEQLLRGRIVEKTLVDKFLNPIPRVREGREALSLGVNAATDISDGLVFNLYTIAESSGVAVHFYSDKIPISQSLLSYTSDGLKALEYALFGGEDYELIVTFNERLLSSVENLGFTVIGEVREGRGVYLDGQLVEKKGYDHFGGEN